MYASALDERKPQGLFHFSSCDRVELGAILSTVSLIIEFFSGTSFSASGIIFLFFWQEMISKALICPSGGIERNPAELD